MNNEIVTDKSYLSEVMNKLPSRTLLNKGITGCGGTHVELTSPRNSLILVPTKELANNKKEGRFIVDGNVPTHKIIKYVNSNVQYKKIIGTYDSLKRIINIIDDSYFLLIDEYHILFNAYSYRNDPIVYLLKNYSFFKDFCFMTATPLKENTILEEIKDLHQVNITWTRAVPVKLDVIDTAFTTKELLKELTKEKPYNYHIFLNSVRTINTIISKLDTTDYKVVCSETSRRNIRTLNVGSTLDPVKKYNFYTATAFEGCDIYDEKGKTIILCDTNISTTILDISTLVRQICGRLRNSKYKDEVTLILNTTKHRYAGITKEQFDNSVKENVKLGKFTEEKFNSDKDPLYKEKELRSYSKETYNSFYVNKYDNKLYYDDNFRKRDEFNYELINEIYNSSISVLKEASDNDFIIEDKEENWVTKRLTNKLYSFQELKDLFEEDFNKKGIPFNGFTIKDYFPEFEKTRKTRHGKKDTYYKFII